MHIIIMYIMHIIQQKNSISRNLRMFRIQKSEYTCFFGDVENCKKISAEKGRHRRFEIECMLIYIHKCIYYYAAWYIYLLL